MNLKWFPIFLGAFAAFAHSVEKWQPAAVPWDRELGSHRVIVKVEDPSGGMAISRIEWRRPDREPEKKAVLVVDLKSGKEIPNSFSRNISAISGEVYFQPVSGAGEYAVYFLPVRIEGGAFPVSRYLPPRDTADAGWAARIDRAAKAEPVRWEAISAYDAWTEMEVVASEGEKKAMMRQWPEGVALIIPGKGKSVRMAEHLPKILTEPDLPGNGLSSARLQGRPGEQLVFQVVLWSPERDLENVKVIISGARSDQPAWLDSKSIQCLSTGRTDWNGKKSESRLNVPKGKVTAVWFSVELPARTGSGMFTVQLEEASGSKIARSVDLELSAAGGPMEDHGDSDPQSLSRLRWLNSTTAVDDEPVKGYAPLQVSGRTVRCLGRELELGEDGLPVQIRSYFNKAVTKVMEKPTLELLQAPAEFFITPPGNGAPEVARTALSGNGLKFTVQNSGVVEWTARLLSHGVKGNVNGRMESDGSVKYRVSLEAEEQPKELGGISLRFLRREESLDYILGLQQETGALNLKETMDWKWDVSSKHQDSLWLGSVNGGMKVQFKADNYVRPSVNIHYRRRPLNDPPSWNAGGTGGISLTPETNGVRGFTAGSGPVTLQPGKPLHFDFDLLITPFHTLRTKEQWSDRYYHTGGVPRDFNKYLDSAKANGANVVNIHQGNWLNPYINYPFLTWEALRDFSRASHDRGMRTKFYYTVRELSNWCPEIFAFRSMGDEILMSGSGGGHPWGEEHLGGNYWQAWYEPGTQDVSFLTQPMSRLHNYYIEGLRWLCENAGCDGIYLDDIAYDRAIMLRARKVLDRYCPRGGLIDLHSWNEFHEGGAWAHCPNIFMDSMPFVDRLWFGEGHHYSGPPPEHFLVEISGIPFGLMGEMLEGGGNPWLGLVHGCTGRLGWGGNPSEVWQLWDGFGVQDAEFIGWWAGEECPVRSADPMVKATVWKKKDATLVALANFSREAKPAALAIDWGMLGLDPARAKMYAPPMAQLKQRAALLEPDKLPLLKPFAGAVYIIDEKPHSIEPSATVEAPGEVILDESFTRELDRAWTPVVSPRAKEAGKLDAGYVWKVPANVHAYLERPLPGDSGGVSTRLWQDGRDEGQQWGPGLAMIWPDGQTLRANIRQDGRLSVFGGGVDSLEASIQTRAPVEFTIRWDKDYVKVIAAGPAMGDLAEEIARIPRSRLPGQPGLLRVGKMPNSAGPSDHGEAGPDGFNRIEWVRIHGRR